MQDVPVVILRINALWQPGMDDDEVYDAARGWWVMGPRRNSVEYVIVVAHGIVRGAFRVHGWRPRRYSDEAGKQQPAGSIKWGFDGEPADELAGLIGADVKALFPQGSANPVRYSTLATLYALAAGSVVTVQAEPEEAEPSEVPAASPRLELLRSACDSLHANEVLHLSLHSKELFHSNLLGWFIERHPHLGHSLLEPWLTTGPYDGPVVVRREQNHLDLVVHLPGCLPLVIENKVFSLPDEKQLDAYLAKNIPAAGLTSSSLALLSLSDPGWPWGSYGDWRWMPYSQVAARLGELLDAGALSDVFVDGLLRRWVRMLGDLQTLVDATQPASTDEPLLLDGDVLALLESVRLHDALQKFRSRSVQHLLERRFAAEGLRPDVLRSEFSNGSPLLTAAVDLPDRSRIGWQLQGQQWRRFLIVPDELAGQSPEQKLVQDDYAGSLHGAWFSFAAEQSLGPFQPAPTSSLKHYAPDFVYDYVKVPGATVGQVLDLGVLVLRAALAYRDELLRRGDAD